jgi:hypothetical protein
MVLWDVWGEFGVSTPIGVDDDDARRLLLLAAPATDFEPLYSTDRPPTQQNGTTIRSNRCVVSQLMRVCGDCAGQTPRDCSHTMHRAPRRGFFAGSIALERGR